MSYDSSSQLDHSSVLQLDTVGKVVVKIHIIPDPNVLADPHPAKAMKEWSNSTPAGAKPGN